MSDALIIKNAVLIPGNGCGRNLNGCMWYPWLANKLTSSKVVVVPNPAFEPKSENAEDKDGEGASKESSEKIQMLLKGFPNHLEAFEHVWKPFAIDALGLCDSSILIGHSSGSACSLRLMEDMPIAACVLVAAYDDDLGDDLEAESGYFNRPFNYDKMVSNCPVIFQFHSANDHLVPVAIARRVAEGLRKASDDYNKRMKESSFTFRPHTFIYVETKKDGHFQDDEYEAIIWKAISEVIPFSE